MDDIECSWMELSAICSMSQSLLKCLAQPQQILLLVALLELDEMGSGLGAMAVD